MTQDVLLLMIATTGFALGAAWAGWMSKTLIAVLTTMERVLLTTHDTSVSVESIETRLDGHDTRIEDHHHRLINLERQ